MLGIEFFATTARVKVGSRRGASIVTEQGKLPVAYATAEGALEPQGAFRSLAGAPMGNGYAGIAPERVLVRI